MRAIELHSWNYRMQMVREVPCGVVPVPAPPQGPPPSPAQGPPSLSISSYWFSLDRWIWFDPHRYRTAYFWGTSLLQLQGQVTDPRSDARRGWGWGGMGGRVVCVCWGGWPTAATFWTGDQTYSPLLTGSHTRRGVQVRRCHTVEKKSLGAGRARFSPF